MSQVVGNPLETAASAVDSTSRAKQARPPVRQSSRLVVFLHALAFVIGFSAVFTLLGSLAGLFSQGLSQNSFQSRVQLEEAMRRLGAVILVIFALATLGFVRWLVQRLHAYTNGDANPMVTALLNLLDFFNGLFYTEKRVLDLHQVNRGWGYFSSALLGVGFAAGWTPCVGPILGSIWMLAGSNATVGQGATLLAIYSLGLGLPFLITGAAFSSTASLLRRINRHARIVSIVSGIFLLYVAFLLWTDSLGLLATRFVFLNDWVLHLEDSITPVLGAGGDIFSPSILAATPLAFFAGVISFLSPCVLPLVPAYIGYLSGTALGGGKS
jgi:cytochrome c-type biogenesis protein